MWPSFSEQTIYMSSFTLWVADDEPASETEISQLQQLLAAMNEFRRTLASVWCNFSVLSMLSEVCPLLRPNLDPRAHVLFGQHQDTELRVLVLTKRHVGSGIKIV